MNTPHQKRSGFKGRERRSPKFNSAEWNDSSQGSCRNQSQTCHKQNHGGRSQRKKHGYGYREQDLQSLSQSSYSGHHDADGGMQSMPTSQKSSGKRRHKSQKRMDRPHTSSSFNESSQGTSKSHSTASESATQTGSLSRESDIPGYYYDEEKKTYFKILPNTLTSVGSFVTQETIQKNEAEKKRLSDIKCMAKKTSQVSSSKLSVSKYKASNHLTSVLENVQCGQFTCQNLQTYMIQHVCLSVQPDAEFVNSSCSSPSMKLEEIKMMEVSPKRDKIVCVSSLDSCLAQCIQLMSVTDDQCSDGTDKKTTTLRIKPPDLAVGPIFKKISSLCWAPVKTLPECNTVLYTTMCPISCYSSIVCLCNLDAPTVAAMNVFEFDLGKKTVWASAWNSYNGQFIIGSDRRCHLIDVQTRRQWSFSTRFSDSLAQLFSPTNPHVMYNGTRKGEILVHDVRNRNSFHPQVVLNQNAGISCLRLLQDENYVLGSDFSGKIYTWDQRMRKRVTTFASHLKNSHYQLPFHLDESESILCGTGCDSYTSFWDVRSGNLLRTIPPPYSVSSATSFPVSFYSNRWANTDGNCALIVGMKNRFKVYCQP